VHTSVSFSVTANSNASSTGWHGRQPPLKDRQAILQAYADGSIKELIASFHRVYYDEYVAFNILPNELIPIAFLRAIEKPALLIDCDNLAFLYRTTIVPWLQDRRDEFHDVTSALLRNMLSSCEVAAAPALHHRPPKTVSEGDAQLPFSCFRRLTQSAQTPSLTLWHREHAEDVDAFMKEKVIQRIM
jgi:hypothetical protein